MSSFKGRGSIRLALDVPLMVAEGFRAPGLGFGVVPGFLAIRLP